MNTESNTFGCKDCWPSAADAAWESLNELRTDVELIDESHYMIKIRSCTKCAQEYLTVFTETIDWACGEDPQYSTRIPLTSVEVEQLIAAGSNLERVISALPRERQSLRHDFPKDSGQTSYWGKGISIGPHD